MAEESDIPMALTWGDLEEWAGAKTLARGRRYQQEGRVRDLARLPDGDVIAWVVGTERYATVVSVDDEFIESRCTCPVGRSCKHAVAVVLEYIASAKNDRPIPTAAENDPRLRLFGPDSAGASTEPHLRPYLEGLTREDLIDLIDALARRDPDVREAIEDRRSVAAGDASSLVRSLLSEIDAATDEGSWDDGYYDGSIPDYSRVQEKMETLLDMGYPDEVVQAGEVLLKKGSRQIETIEDGGEAIDQITASMDIVFAALAASPRPAHEKILYAIEAGLEDEFDVCAGAEKLLAEDFSKEEWSIVADRLLRRLKRMTSRSKNNDFASKYHRNRLVTAIVAALDKAGRPGEATDLRIEEAGRTDAYPEVVIRLLNEGRRDEALQWISRGIARTARMAPGVAERLRFMLRDLLEKEGNWLTVAAIRAEEFFCEPSYPAFRAMEEASHRAGVSNDVRDVAMRYLITGERPPAEGGVIPGVLPDTGIMAREPRQKIAAPIIDTLIEIAIAEEKPDAILHWYNQCKEEGAERYLRNNLENRVADALVDAYPERSIAIWKKKAEGLIAETNPKSYEASLQYLRRLHSHMEAPAWEEYIGELRRKHLRKKRFLEVLDRVVNRRIIEDMR